MERSVSKGSYITSSIKYDIIGNNSCNTRYHVVVPLYAMILGGLKSNLEAASTPILLPPSKPSLDAYAFAWFGYATIPGLEPTLLRYLLVAIPSVLLSVVIGTMTAYFLLCT